VRWGRRLRTLLSSPSAAPYRILGKVAPDSMWRRYADQCRQAGLERSVFVLSFDCDTDLDIRVVEGVHERLVNMGIPPVYAVPGELLERGSDTYRRIAAAAAEFMNHGYVQHTTVDAGRTRYVSSFSYDEVGFERVATDIEEGHRAHERVLGRLPKGFRTPHFGEFQRPHQLRFLHRTLRSLGYRYSSSTVPFEAFRRGPWRDDLGVREFPVTGCPDWPLSVLDTWGFRFAPDKMVDERDFVRQIRRLGQLMETTPLFVNIYGDPSQVYDWPEFFEAVAGLSPFAVASFDRLLEVRPR